MSPEGILASCPGRSGIQRAAAMTWAQRVIDRLDARLLLEHVTGCSAATLLAHPEQVLRDEEVDTYVALVMRRHAGEPLAYLTGVAGFMGDLLRVSPAVLVPRPETEELVGWALTCLTGCESPAIADLGTGSGAIALALAAVRPDAQILAIDVSPEALAVAEKNRDALGRHQITFCCSSWFSGVSAEPRFDLIVSNPPYIGASDPHLMGDGVRFEPRSALTDEADGLDAYRALAEQAVCRLRPSGWLLVEHGHDQAGAVAALWSQAGLIDIESRCDLSGNPRMTGGRKPRNANAAVAPGSRHG